MRNPRIPHPSTADLTRLRGDKIAHWYHDRARTMRGIAGKHDDPVVRQGWLDLAGEVDAVGDFVHRTVGRSRLR